MPFIDPGGQPPNEKGDRRNEQRIEALQIAVVGFMPGEFSHGSDRPPSSSQTGIGNPLDSLEEPDPIEERIEPAGSNAIGAVVVVAMMARVARWGQDESPGM